MSTSTPIASMPQETAAAPLAVRPAERRAQMSFIHPAMVETIALSPVRRTPSPRASEPPPELLCEAPGRDVEAQWPAAPRPGPWPTRAWEPMLASALTTLVTSVHGAAGFKVFEGLQGLTGSPACTGRALHLTAWGAGMLGGALVTGLEYRQAAHHDRIDLLTLRAAMLSASMAAGADVVASALALYAPPDSAGCLVPVVMRSSASLATLWMLADQFAAAPPQQLYATGRALRAPLLWTRRAAAVALRRIGRRRWH